MLWGPMPLALTKSLFRRPNVKRVSSSTQPLLVFQTLSTTGYEKNTETYCKIGNIRQPSFGCFVVNVLYMSQG